MPSYATIDEIKAVSANVPPIMRGTDEAILAWATEAYVNINSHCRMNFDFEQQATRSVQLGAYSDVYLPKVISGQIAMTRALSGQSAVAVDSRHVEITPDSFVIRYNGPRSRGLNPAVSTLYLTGDWGYAPSREYLLIKMANCLKTNYNLHRVSTSHLAPDSLNVVDAPDATDLASAIVLLNNLLTEMTGHFETVSSHVITPAPMAAYPVATTEDEAITLANALKIVFNAHVVSTIFHNSIDPYTISISVLNTVLPDEIKLAFTKVVQRLAIRDNAEDLRYHNSGFASESFSDGYSYSIDGGARHIITPSEMALLSEHVNEGRVAY